MPTRAWVSANLAALEAIASGAPTLNRYPDGGMQVEVFFLVDRGEGGYRSGGSFDVPKKTRG